jgi:hypothetical protein
MRIRLFLVRYVGIFLSFFAGLIGTWLTGSALGYSEIYDGVPFVYATQNVLDFNWKAWLHWVSAAPTCALFFWSFQWILGFRMSFFSSLGVIFTQAAFFLFVLIAVSFLFYNPQMDSGIPYFIAPLFASTFTSYALRVYLKNVCPNCGAMLTQSEDGEHLHPKAES